MGLDGGKLLPLGLPIHVSFSGTRGGADFQGANFNILSFLGTEVVWDTCYTFGVQYAHAALRDIGYYR